MTTSAAGEQCDRAFADFGGNFAMSSSAPYSMPGMTWPRLRPEALQPISPTSATTASAPDRTKQSALESLAIPALTTATAAWVEVSSGEVAEGETGGVSRID